MTAKKTQSDDSWHLSKTVNISHLVTTVVLVVGAIGYIGDIEQDVAILQVEQNNIKSKMVEHKSSYDHMFNRIDEKLDKLFDLFHESNGK